MIASLDTFATDCCAAYFEYTDQVVGKDVGSGSCCKQEALDHAVAITPQQLDKLWQEESHLQHIRG